MKNIVRIFFIVSLIFSFSFESHAKRKKISSKQRLVNALQLAKKREFQKASEQLYRLSFSSKHKRYRNQINYMLGLMLYQMKFYQLAAFQFVIVIKTGDKKYLGPAIEKLSLSADVLGDNTLLNYAISRVSVRKFPKSSRDMLYFRIGEIQQRAKQYKSSAKSFRRVSSKSPKYLQAKYQEALNYALNGESGKALVVFEELLEARVQRNVTDPSRVAALMGMARTYYQKKKWDKAIEYYRQVPRDSRFWHETLFESSWAMMRSGKFRSAISNFQSLHSSFYEDYYLPESLILRSIVYLYICRYDEMDKVLNLFSKIYEPVQQKIDTKLRLEKTSANFYKWIAPFMRGEVSSTLHLPLSIIRKISEEGDVLQSHRYIEKLKSEKERINKMLPFWQKAPIGKYAKRVLDIRIKKAERSAGKKVRSHLYSIQSELRDLFDQEGYIRFEMLNSKKENLKKKVIGKVLPKQQVDEDFKRSFYIQNGYQYWPYSGENWLDELGNYHYLGVQACEQ